MNILTIILTVIAVIILLVLVLALITKNEYEIERQVIINKPVAVVFEYVKYIKNQDNYSKWVMIDPAMQKNYRGIDGTVGFAYAWDSKNKQAGKGEQVIQKITDNKQIDIRIEFIRPFSGIADSCIATETVAPDKTSVKWRFKSKMPYPMNVMMLFINMDKMLGSDLELSLNKLKQILEKI
ncbi:SRPBCC family protein [Mucilaginibacter segetis]|uniref:SRPBCC family protein n=1 Tax=Mucilaginibacter segetis TaxID=2793071 RepID=A0A934UNB5_9SPHI|nr:SRPBCC family protein [Mucilaginibacter segetis]MBK0379900.1 SRPBCC family protein [Mucilaginibacter segetis]